MHIVRDLLDKSVVDRHGRSMGRVDRVIVDRRNGSPPRVAAIEIGASALGDRLGVAVGRWTAGILHAFNVDVGQPLRIDVHQMLDVADKVKVDVAFGETPAANVERNLRAVISVIPGATR